MGLSPCSGSSAWSTPRWTREKRMRSSRANVAPSAVRSHQASASSSPAPWFRIDADRLSSVAGPLLRSTSRPPAATREQCRCTPQSVPASCADGKVHTVDCDAPTNHVRSAEELSAWRSRPWHSLFACGHDRCASVFCLVAATILSVSILLVTYMFVSEVSNTRDDLRPIMQAALPLMRDSQTISNLAVETSQQVLQVAHTAHKVTNLLPPAMSEFMRMLNSSASTLEHVEQLSRHPVLKIDMSSS